MATTAKKKPVNSAKKPVKKSTKSTAAKAKTTSKKVTQTKTKTEAVKSTAVSTTSRERRVLSPIEKIRSTHLASAFAFIILAVISYFVVGTASSELLLSAQARDTFANTDSVVLGSASEVLATVQYRYLLIALLVVSALGSLLLATRLRARYETAVSGGVSGFKWLLIGLVSGLSLSFVSFIGGVQDLATLKVSAALVLAGALFGWFSDRDNKVSGASKTAAYYAALFSLIFALLPLAGSLIGTTLFGDERFGWHVYALSAVVVVSFAAILSTLKASITNRANLAYVAYEQRYLRIHQTVLFLIVLIIFSSFAK